jgi:hypothetical protein
MLESRITLAPNGREGACSGQGRAAGRRSLRASGSLLGNSKKASTARAKYFHWRYLSSLSYFFIVLPYMIQIPIHSGSN